MSDASQSDLKQQKNKIRLFSKLKYIHEVGDVKKKQRDIFMNKTLPTR